ncbi:MAG: T9SS type A sorting domain-containing protein [Crocinitomicaceae bacterium]|nr:T9SS type A sorting domain-containing protein [Crocinitomicaceae bacterium]
MSTFFGLEIPQYISTDLTIFPNPGNGLFYVRITNPQDEYSLDVFNSAMSKVFSIDVFCPEYSDRIDLSGMTKGFYFIRLTGANSLIIEKIVIE